MLIQTVKLGAMSLVRRKVYYKIFIRNLSKITDQTVPVSVFKLPNVNEKDKQQYDSLFPVIAKDLAEAVKEIGFPDITKWYTEILKYNLWDDKQRRGLSVVLSYKLLEDPKKLIEENNRLANILGWSTDMILSLCLMLNDIRDQSQKRKNVDFTTINDATSLESGTYFILRKYFRDHPCYLSLVELFHEAVFNTFKGQVLEHLNSYKRKHSLQHFTMDRYNATLMYSTGYITLYFPVTAAMYLVNIQDEELHRKAAAILHEMGCYNQIKNDFLNGFGNMESNGSTHYSDIRQGKCTWPAVVTLQRATPNQRAVMEKCYGHSDEHSVQAVMELYKVLDLPSFFASYEEDTFNNIRSQIEHMDSRFPKQIFYSAAEKINTCTHI